MSAGNTFSLPSVSLMYAPQSEEAGHIKNQIVADARAEGITVTELLVRRKQQGQTQLSANQGPAAKTAGAAPGYHASDGTSDGTSVGGFDDGASTAETLVPGMENEASRRTGQGEGLAQAQQAEREKKGLRQRISERVKEYREDK